MEYEGRKSKSTQYSTLTSYQGGRAVSNMLNGKEEKKGVAPFPLLPYSLLFLSTSHLL